jgi:hypothetical protein
MPVPVELRQVVPLGVEERGHLIGLRCLRDVALADLRRFRQQPGRDLIPETGRIILQLLDRL